MFTGSEISKGMKKGQHSGWNLYIGRFTHRFLAYKVCYYLVIMVQLITVDKAALFCVRICTGSFGVRSIPTGKCRHELAIYVSKMMLGPDKPAGHPGPWFVR